MTEVRDRRDGKKGPPRSGTGREELRSTWFRPYLLRLRAERGEAALRALLTTAGIPIGLMNDDAGWLSVSAGKPQISGMEASSARRAAHSSSSPWPSSLSCRGR